MMLLFHMQLFDLLFCKLELKTFKWKVFPSAFFLKYIFKVADTLEDIH